MKRNLLKAISAITAILMLGTFAAGCTTTQQNNGVYAATLNTTTSAAASSLTTVAAGASTLELSELFSDRDLEQSADLTSATAIKLVSGQDVTLNDSGVFVLSGEATDVTIIVEVAEDAKIQLVLDGVRISNVDSPAIYVKSADKVFVTTTDSQNELNVTGSFVADGDTNLDAVIFSTSDLTLNGSGSLKILSSAGNGISSKDDLRITGGAYDIQSQADSLEANDAILIYDGNLTIESGKDALHSENSDDPALGYIFIQNGVLHISAADDAMRGNSLVQINGGTIDITTCTEGIEANRIQINGGQINLYAKNDGFNAAPKVNAEVLIEVNGGTINVRMGSGDTDAFDSNGNIVLNGGTITVEAGSAFDADGAVAFNAGDVTVNGTKVTQITSVQGMGGGKTRR